jgi:hypothetical protein
MFAAPKIADADVVDRYNEPSVAQQRDRSVDQAQGTDQVDVDDADDVLQAMASNGPGVDAGVIEEDVEPPSVASPNSATAARSSGRSVTRHA